MFEHRVRGAQLVKNISYTFLIIAIFLIIVRATFGFAEITDASILFYIIMAIVLYLISTKLKENKYAWILVVICAIITVVLHFKLVGIAFAILLVSAANDIKKELDNDS